MIQIHDVEQGTDGWHQLRAGKYTGSNAHKLLKFGAIEYSMTNPTNFRGNFYTKRGHILEDEALELYVAITHREIARVGFITNDRFPNCGYSPDAMSDDRTIEVKCFKPDKHMKMFYRDVPLEILAQCYFGMLICEKPQCDLVIYNPDLDAQHAFKIINIKTHRNINANFKRILTK
jgi:hypothetical protein